MIRKTDVYLDYAMSSEQTEAERRHALVGPPRFWKMKRDFQINFLTQMGLQPHHHLLDIGCGTLRGGIPVIRYLDKGHYYGTEVREAVLDEGRLELQEAGLEDKEPGLILSTDVSTLSIDRRFDMIWAYSVFLHMTDEILQETMHFVARHLADGGACYANVNLGTRGSGGWQGFPVVWRSMEFYQDVCETADLRATDHGAVQEFGHVSGVAAMDKQRILKITHKG